MTEKMTTKKIITVKKPVLDYSFYAKEVEKELKFEDGEPIFNTERDLEKYLLYLLMQRVSQTEKNQEMPLILPIVHDNRFYKQLCARVQQQRIEQFNDWAKARGLKHTDKLYQEIYDLMCDDEALIHLEASRLKTSHFDYQIQISNLTKSLKSLVADKTFNQKLYEDEIVYRKKLKQQEKEREEYFAKWD